MFCAYAPPVQNGKPRKRPCGKLQAVAAYPRIAQEIAKWKGKSTAHRASPGVCANPSERGRKAGQGRWDRLQPCPSQEEAEVKPTFEGAAAARGNPHRDAWGLRSLLVGLPRSQSADNCRLALCRAIPGFARRGRSMAGDATGPNQGKAAPVSQS